MIFFGAGMPPNLKNPCFGLGCFNLDLTLSFLLMFDGKLSICMQFLPILVIESVNGLKKIKGLLTFGRFTRGHEITRSGLRELR